MIKIKGEICDIALLLHDKEDQIQNIVKQFLHEVHEKDVKIIYNLIPEAIRRLSSPDNLNLQVDSFQIFLKSILPYLEKDKFSEILVDKICTIFKTSVGECP